MATSWNQLWLDRPDAMKQIDRSAVSEDFKVVARELIEDGISVLRGWHERPLCAQVIKDHQQWCAENSEIVARSLEFNGREKRLCNFHHWSESALAIGQNSRVMSLLDFLFGYEAGVYTSLTFKYGTQQPVHRDTPHFATWPENYFFGVWVALEDVNPDAGPLFYYRKAHKFQLDPGQFWEKAKDQNPNSSRQEICLAALRLYDHHIMQEAAKYGPPVLLNLNAGDSVIWHPQAPHGGSLANNPALTRWSIVFHCAPIHIQVHQHDRFFTHHVSEAPPPRYDFVARSGRRLALAGDVAFM